MSNKYFYNYLRRHMDWVFGGLVFFTGALIYLMDYTSNFLLPFSCFLLMGVISIIHGIFHLANKQHKGVS